MIQAFNVKIETLRFMINDFCYTKINHDILNHYHENNY